MSFDTHPDHTNSFLELLIKAVLTVLFFLCLLDMPYGFYEFVRFLALVGFSILSYYQYKRGNKIRTWTYIALAVLFQPLLKISLGRTMWNIVDVVVALWLIFTIIQHFKSTRS